MWLQPHWQGVLPTWRNSIFTIWSMPQGHNTLGKKKDKVHFYFTLQQEKCAILIEL